jgi:hypothetical protein
MRAQIEIERKIRERRRIKKINAKDEKEKHTHPFESL